MSLWVEVDELHGAGTQIVDAVAAPGTLAGAAVSPAAADQVSAGVASALSARFGVLATHTARGAHVAGSAASVLHANAATYQRQEDLNTAALRAEGPPASAAATRPPTAPPFVPATLPAMPPPPPAGVSPVDGKMIAALIHGGPGPRPLLDAAQRARAHAAQLRGIGTELRTATTRLSQGWRSPAAEAAVGRIATLAGWYDQHAEHAMTAARACDTQAEAFAHTRATVPRPEVFDDLERRLLAATRANTATGGRYTPVVTALQTQLAATHTQAQSAYADYGARAAALPTDTSTPPPSTVHALDDHTFKQEPPPPDPGADPPWKHQPSPRTLEEVQDALRQLRRGENKPNRELDTPEEIQDFFDWLTGNSTGHAPSSAPFPRERLDDGTIISLRPDSTSGGETIGVTAPDGRQGPKVHLPLAPPIISGPPQLPPLGSHPPFAPPLLPPAPAPDPTSLPPWLQNPALHGTPIPSQGPTIMPGVPLPATPAPVTSTPSDPGPALLPRIGHDLADAGEKIAIGGLIGIAVIGGLLGIGSPGQAATP